MKNRYEFEFTATYAKKIIIEAEDLDEAYELAEKLYCDGEPTADEAYFKEGDYNLGLIQLPKDYVEGKFVVVTKTEGMTSFDDINEAEGYETLEEARNRFEQLVSDSPSNLEVVKRTDNAFEYWFRDNGANCRGEVYIIRKKQEE